MDIRDLLYRRRENEIILLNRETGKWYVGKDEERIVEKLINTAGGSVDFEKNLVKKLIQENILITNSENVSIEQPDSELLSLLILDTTNKCNLACKYCFVSATEEGIFMPIDTAINALKLALNHPQCAQTLTIEFSGGEPMLNFDLIEKFVPIAEKMAEDRGKNLTFTIQTNGTMLNKKNMDYLLQHRFNVGISIDGMEEIHDKNRVFANGNGSLGVIRKNIRRFMELGGNVSILAVISSVEQYDSILQFALENGIKDIRTNLVTQIGRAMGKEEFAIEYKKLADKFVEVSKRILRGELKINDATLTFYLWNLLMLQPHMCFRSPCGAAKNQISVTAFGEVYPCQSWRNVKDIPMGNVNEENNLENMISKSKRAKELRERNVRDIEPCKKCEWKMFCGVCPREVYSCKGNIYDKIPQCIFQNNVFEALIWEFGKNQEGIRKYLIGEYDEN